MQMFGGFIVLFEAHYKNNFSILHMVCTGLSQIERWIREIFLSSDWEVTAQIHVKNRESMLIVWVKKHNNATNHMHQSK